MKETLTIRTRERMEMIDITSLVQNLVDRSGVEQGICMVFVPHTTAAVTINENADPDVRRDIITHLSRLIPREGSFRHGEGNSDSHIKVSLTGVSQLVTIENGHLDLGTWQSLFFCEFDGPRRRRCNVKIVAG